MTSMNFFFFGNNNITQCGFLMILIRRTKKNSEISGRIIRVFCLSISLFEKSQVINIKKQIYIKPCLGEKKQKKGKG